MRTKPISQEYGEYHHKELDLLRGHNRIVKTAVSTTNEVDLLRRQNRIVKITVSTIKKR